jgi:hypothetical protein
LVGVSYFTFFFSSLSAVTLPAIKLEDELYEILNTQVVYRMEMCFQRKQILLFMACS